MSYGVTFSVQKEGNDLLFKSTQPQQKYHDEICRKDWSDCDCEEKMDEAFKEAMRILTNNSPATTAYKEGWQPPESKETK